MKISREKWNTALLNRYDKERTERFINAKVAVCGLGGLGSSIAVLLTRAGIGTLFLYDFDSVDIENLNRQQYKFSQVGTLKTEALKENLLEINPFIKLITCPVKITEDNAEKLLKDADIICEAFDNPTDKSMLLNVFAEKLSNKFFVGASGMAGLGSPNSIRTKRFADRIYICGDGESDVEVEKTLYAPRAMLCAAHEAQTVLRILDNQFEE